MKGLELAKKIREKRDNGQSVESIAEELDKTIVIVYNYLDITNLNDHSLSLIEKDIVKITPVVSLLIRLEHDYKKCDEILLDLSICHEKITAKHIAAKLRGKTAQVISKTTESIVFDWLEKSKVTENTDDTVTINCNKLDWQQFTLLVNERYEYLKCK